MPFTGSHPAAVLPFLRTPLPASALVIGSMAPDFPYYFPRDPHWTTHTVASLVYADLPLGLAVWLLWHGLLAAPALAAAPNRLRVRLSGIEPGVHLEWLVVPAVALGIATHLAWDEFTHGDRYAVRHLAFLHESWHGLAGYHWAQYASGLFGAVVLAVWARRWWVRTPPVPVPPREAHPVLWLVLLAVGAVAGISSALGTHSFGAAGFNGATRGGGAALAVAIVYAIAWRTRRVRR